VVYVGTTPYYYVDGAYYVATDAPAQQPPPQQSTETAMSNAMSADSEAAEAEAALAEVPMTDEDYNYEVVGPPVGATVPYLPEEADEQSVAGKTYFHFEGTEDGEGMDYSDSNVEIQLESLEDEAWISLALENKVLITGSEEQMRAMLAKNGKIAGSGSHNGALLVLTAEKTMLQAGMNSASLGDDEDSGWDSNILRNTEQVAFLMAAAANKLALEAKLITTEPEMAESLASVVRGLISLTAFSDEMDAEAIAMLQGTKVKAEGNSLSISLAVDPDLMVRTISD